MKCAYRNCETIISGGKPNKIYCCRDHKQNERKYRKRESDKLEKIHKLSDEELKEVEILKKIMIENGKI